MPLKVHDRLIGRRPMHGRHEGRLFRPDGAMDMASRRATAAIGAAERLGAGLAELEAKGYVGEAEALRKFVLSKFADALLPASGQGEVA